MKRDMSNAVIAGVCSGLARELNVSVDLVRIAAVASFFLTGSVTLWIYLIMALVVPKE